jgi:hypothetical protein
MSTAIFTVGETKWGHPPDAESAVVAGNVQQGPSLNHDSVPPASASSNALTAPEDDSIQTRKVARASWSRWPGGTIAAASIKTIMDKFVELVKDNPKVWAVCATEDPSGITVWTYIDSADRNDRSLVYEAEWQLLNLYPEVGFDFNTALVPTGHEQFDDSEKGYLYRR